MRRQKRKLVLLNEATSTKCVDSIPERIAFIKVNRLLSRCVDDFGVIDHNKLKEVVRGVWTIRNVEKRSQIQYLFALYQCHILAIYHVTNVSAEISEAWNAGLPDFPSFPEDVRQCDRWKAHFESLVQARQELTSEEYNIFYKDLVSLSGRGTPDQKLARFRRRIYFSVDNRVSENINQYTGCVVKRTDGLGGRILSDCFNPVILNF